MKNSNNHLRHFDTEDFLEELEFRRTTEDSKIATNECYQYIIHKVYFRKSHLKFPCACDSFLKYPFQTKQAFQAYLNLPIIRFCKRRPVTKPCCNLRTIILLAYFSLVLVHGIAGNTAWPAVHVEKL